jgi:hypothetical protein
MNCSTARAKSCCGAVGCVCRRNEAAACPPGPCAVVRFDGAHRRRRACDLAAGGRGLARRQPAAAGARRRTPPQSGAGRAPDRGRPLVRVHEAPDPCRRRPVSHDGVDRAPVCGGVGASVQLRPGEHGRGRRPLASAARVDDGVVPPRGITSSGDNRDRERSTRASACQRVGRRHDVVVGWPALPGVGQVDDRHIDPSVLRLRPRAHLLHVDIGSVLAIRNQGHLVNGARCHLRSRRAARQRDRARDRRARHRLDRVHRPRLRAVRSPRSPVLSPASRPQRTIASTGWHRPSARAPLPARRCRQARACRSPVHAGR